LIIQAKNEEDEVMLGLMIEICAHSHQAEKALSLFNTLKEKGFTPNSMPYNAVMKALASRRDYA